MVFTGYFVWWYGAGMQQSLQIAFAVLGRLADFFSLQGLVKTWFAPWKNDVLSARNISLGDQFKLWEMNFVSRVVGFFVRTIIIVVALLVLGLTAILALLVLGVWIVLPLLIIALPLIGVRMMFQ
jgi:hypothetical protein